MLPLRYIKMDALPFVMSILHACVFPLSGRVSHSLLLFSLLISV